MANESCGKVPWNTKLKILECFVWNVFSSRGNLPTWNPLTYLYAKGRHYCILDLKLHHQFTWCYITCHAWLWGPSHMHYFKSNIGIWKLTYFDSSPILWTWNEPFWHVFKTWVVAIVFKMVVKNYGMGTSSKPIMNIYNQCPHCLYILDMCANWCSMISCVAFALSMCNWNRYSPLSSPLAEEIQWSSSLGGPRLGWFYYTIYYVDPPWMPTSPCRVQCHWGRLIQTKEKYGALVLHFPYIVRG